MKFAYADPPYPGMSHLYKDHPDYAGEVDHKALIERLVAEYPDGWALSTSSSAVRWLWPMCPEDTRLAIYCISNRLGYGPHIQYGWDAVLWRGGRGRARGEAPADWYVGSADLTRFVGIKPGGYCVWVFRLWGAMGGDTLDDLYPGSGAVSRAWEKYQRQLSFIHTEEDYSGKKVKLPI